MVKLHLVGFSSDLKSLVFSTRRGAKSGTYTIDVNPRLKRTLEEIESRQAENDEAAAKEEEAAREAKTASAQRRPTFPQRPATPLSRISPKEIQALLREGKTPDEVAQIAEADVSWIERFTSPIIAERAVVVDIVKAARISRTRRGLSSVPVGEAIVANLADKKVRLSPEEFDGGWTAIRRDGQWEVTFAYTSRGRDVDAVFVVDHERTVRPFSPQASVLGWRPQPGEEDDEDVLLDTRPAGPAPSSPPVPLTSSALEGIRPKPVEGAGPSNEASEVRPRSSAAAHDAGEQRRPEVTSSRVSAPDVGPPTSDPGPAPEPPDSPAPVPGGSGEPEGSAGSAGPGDPEGGGGKPAAPAESPEVPNLASASAHRGWSLPSRRVSQAPLPGFGAPSPRAGADADPPKATSKISKATAKPSGRRVRPERPVPAGSTRAQEPASKPAAPAKPAPPASKAGPSAPSAGPAGSKLEPSQAKAGPSRLTAVPSPAGAKAAPSGTGTSSAALKSVAPLKPKTPASRATASAPVPLKPVPSASRAARSEAPAARPKADRAPSTEAPSRASPKPSASRSPTAPKLGVAPPASPRSPAGSKPPVAPTSPSASGAATPRPRAGGTGAKAGQAPLPKQRTAAAEGPSAGVRTRRIAPPKEARQASSSARATSDLARSRPGSPAARSSPASPAPKAGAQPQKPAAPAKSTPSASKRRREPAPPLRPGQAVSLADVGWSLPADRAARRSPSDRASSGKESPGRGAPGQDASGKGTGRRST